MDKTKHCDTCYHKGNVNASQAVNEPQFRKLTCLNQEEEFYEVQHAKERVKLDVPIQIAIFILNLAKLRLLMFHYDHLDRLVDRSDYMLCETDTDSLYLALSKPTFEEVLRPDLKEEYLKTLKGQCKDGPTPSLVYFPRSCCEKHALFDKREPGVFKTEFVGDEMIGLCSKTYFVENRDLQISKMSCKGVNKKLVENPKEVFKNVLKRKRPETCENRGIRAKGTTMLHVQTIKNRVQLFLCETQSTRGRGHYSSLGSSPETRETDKTSSNSGRTVGRCSGINSRCILPMPYYAMIFTPICYSFSIVFN